jgi:hypothetical protein
MEKQQTSLRSLLEALFGPQREDECFSSGDGILLVFVADAGCAEQVLSILRAKKALGTILDVNESSLSETSEEEMQRDDEEPQERSPEEDIACAESALATLSEAWVQNIFGAEVADVVFDALNELIESRQKFMAQQKTVDISGIEHTRQARKLDD